ncbi:MAG TPA: acetyltransferase, partial [Myxococcota bacterium]|nr:acetyltransferase [Myxococcota bacterium]
MHELVIYGSGGHAREIAQLVDDVNAARPTWSFLGFLDDDAARHGMTLGGGRVLGGGDWLRSRSSVAVTVAIGNSVHRRRVVSALHGARFATLIHPRASIGARVSIGTGSMVCAGAVITCDVQLGSHVIVNVGSTVSHDCVLD